MSAFVNNVHRLVAAVAVSAALSGAAPAWAASYEGQWSVVVTPEYGSCDGPYILPVKVVENRIIYIGKGQFEAQGGVEPNGTIRVTFVSQGDRLDAKGKMSNDRFALGSWTSPTEKCAGTWVARKR